MCTNSSIVARHSVIKESSFIVNPQEFSRTFRPKLIRYCLKVQRHRQHPCFYKCLERVLPFFSVFLRQVSPLAGSSFSALFWASFFFSFFSWKNTQLKNSQRTSACHKSSLYDTAMLAFMLNIITKNIIMPTVCIEISILHLLIKHRNLPFNLISSEGGISLSTFSKDFGSSVKSERPKHRRKFSDAYISRSAGQLKSSRILIALLHKALLITLVQSTPHLFSLRFGDGLVVCDNRAPQCSLKRRVTFLSITANIGSEYFRVHIDIDFESDYFNTEIHLLKLSIGR